MGRHLLFTEQKIEAMKKAGRGQGKLADYQPWLMVDDFPSLGRGNRVRDIHTGRVHHFFSDLEMQYYFILAWNPNIVDIREQYPLDTELTEVAAARLGYPHPKNQDGSSYVMTTDFLITYCPEGEKEAEYYARSVKTEKDLSKKRTLQKQQIERCYWQEQNVQWKCVTENSFSRQKAKNIRKILSFYDYDDFKDESLKRAVEELLVQEIQDIPQQPLSAICSHVEKAYQLRNGAVLSLFYYLTAHRMIEVDMNQHFLPTMPVQKFLVSLPFVNIIQRERSDRYAVNDK
ncbi:MAG: TnsA endonuclease N-terminal domain-containing protein [Oscillospiraceae bacterium]|jgi:hypothetical protein|nr:TnsA endonuclease N-terminal domain-containing protein [Oscillospiraceae bacterium]